MVPAKPPLPTTCSLPFQFMRGSHTSDLMSDLGVGLSVSDTRQAAETSWTRVTVIAGVESDVRLSHVAACDSAGTASRTRTTLTARATFKIRGIVETPRSLVDRELRI